MTTQSLQAIPLATQVSQSTCSTSIPIPSAADPAGGTVSQSTDTFFMPNPTREVYSHGHHNSVLRSHRWRTAENSAAYLLPRLKPADRLLDVGIGPGTITIDLAGRLSEGSVVGIDSAPAAVAATQDASRRPGRAESHGCWSGTSTTWDSTTPPSTSFMPISCCSTSPTRSRPFARCAGSARQAVLSPYATPTMRP